nr:FimD/PapC N-terminal domain-containing protein [Escherichia coli]
MSGSYSSVWAEDDIQFDSRFLELKGDTKIDLKRFSSQGYVEPGKYNLQVQLRKVRISTLRNENETFSQLNSITYIGVFLRLVTYSHLP